ncbi:hypothetical protein MPTK1_8g01960 [Marchantia polymorpha subsp. ruderalis]|uniref:Uncharacterized protein n=1 Tax=Marchantia polymorpha TaxID=3197 RepID=A0A2R6WR25_MARPO|nr:hypothetical protein MARPO_0064s0004 [Marchantia polymorpha]BBN18362.1 hypothetical protein Mp_8g01960 [Marchantia polymorpha subsp. ruderalis]|eukprot:PTQ36311.1 hypothetical protein MARPO_0064s0004 [Marchantia polymorpha]
MKLQHMFKVKLVVGHFLYKLEIQDQIPCSPPFQALLLLCIHALLLLRPQAILVPRRNPSLSCTRSHVSCSCGSRSFASPQSYVATSDSLSSGEFVQGASLDSTFTRHTSFPSANRHKTQREEEPPCRKDSARRLRRNRQV